MHPNNAAYKEKIANLPVTPFLDGICSALKSSPSHFLILTAETAAGKSTAVPLTLLENFPGNILMLEPRRLAALAIASRVSELLGEPLGQTAGYRMHLESRISNKTRLEVITEAILTRRLQNDPALEDVNVIVIDEFHERSIHSDLALAFLKETMQLREDLYVIVMSATIDTEQLSEYLGTETLPAPVFRVPGRQFPVSIEYAGNINPAQAVLNELNQRNLIRRKQHSPDIPEDNGAILVFLPGISDIRRCRAQLEEAGLPDAFTEIFSLHSSVRFEDQKKILSPAPDGITRIILSSSIAETSLTVPGVTTVIDSGLARVSRMNAAAGMERLVTEPESIFSAQQRAGRAGRLAPGRCVRLWKESDPRIKRMPPEIMRTDLTALVLECAQWGITDKAKLSWLDQPNEASWNNAAELLEQTGCLKQKQITPLGAAALRLGIHPRLACTALAGSIKKALEYSRYAQSEPALRKRFCTELEQRIEKAAAHLSVQGKNTFAKSTGSRTDAESAALLAGFPDRIAHLVNGDGVYQFPSGRTAHLPPEDCKNSSSFPEWIVAPEADAGDREGKIYSYEPLSEAFALEWLKARAVKTMQLSFIKNSAGTVSIQETELTCYGRIVLSSKKVSAELKDYAEAICTEIKNKGLEILPISKNTEALLARARFYEQQNGATQSERKAGDENLTETAEHWLLPFLGGETKISAETVYNALYWYLNGAELDRLVPSGITLPNGRKQQLTYELQSLPTDKTKVAMRPVLEIIIQRIFGCFETPRIMGMPVLLKLLSPARRPLQITDDLENFWKDTWPQICREMKGRYPKHNWDYKVCENE